ncbi:hypothetical protein CDL15_Pgr001031 [Punica granatum]|uniref:Uncharacterized protein n=1 Tax=Punica granatum TaxID=22663 RepID=A0A218X0Z3_PUNGR|nr:hypothetical protein CDL15_Pgr001031 [Punica granatum]
MQAEDKYSKIREPHHGEADKLRRWSLARIENKAKLPLRPAPIENPFTEAVTALRIFSESVRGIESKTSE